MAQELAEVAGCAIGIRGVIDDTVATGLSRLLYTAIGHGYPVGRAVSIAVAALEMHGIRDLQTVTIANASAVDPTRLFVCPVGTGQIRLRSAVHGKYAAKFDGSSSLSGL